MSPSPSLLVGISTDLERVLAEFLWLQGVAGDGIAELELILGGVQSLAGSRWLEGCVVVPMSIENECQGSLTVEMCQRSGPASQCGEELCHH